MSQRGLKRGAVVQTNVASLRLILEANVKAVTTLWVI